MAERAGKGDHAAAFAHLPDVGVQVRPGRLRSPVKCCPAGHAHLAIRTYNALMEAVFWFLSRKTPGVIKWLLRARQSKPARRLRHRHTLQAALQPVGPADVPDPRRRHVHHDHRGPRRSGHRPHRPLRRHRHRAQVREAPRRRHHRHRHGPAAAGARWRLDQPGRRARSTADRFVYKAHMLEDVPNLFWCVGYTNASWTLRADITARATAKLLAHMASHGYTHATRTSATSRWPRSRPGTSRPVM